MFGQTWLHDTNPLIDCKIAEPTRCELLMAKQFIQMLRKEKYALFLDGAPGQSCINDCKETIECLQLVIFEEFTEFFSTESPTELFLDHHIDLLPGTKPLSRALTDSPSLRPVRLKKLYTNFSPKVRFARVRLHGLLLCFLPPRRMSSYGFALITELKQGNRSEIISYPPH